MQNSKNTWFNTNSSEIKTVKLSDEIQSTESTPKNENSKNTWFNTNSSEIKTVKLSDVIQSTESTPKNKIYIYVPFEYKDEAKKLGAKFDFDKKKWYTYKNNTNYQKLVDKYHSDNFRYDFYGSHLNSYWKTEKERSEHYKAKNKEREQELLLIKQKQELFLIKTKEKEKEYEANYQKYRMLRQQWIDRNENGGDDFESWYSVHILAYPEPVNVDEL
jgi:hypothetical protein